MEKKDDSIKQTMIQHPKCIIANFILFSINVNRTINQSERTLINQHIIRGILSLQSNWFV